MIIKTLHVRSYGIGILSGIVILLLFMGTKSLLVSDDAQQNVPSNRNVNNQDRERFQRDGQRLQRGNAVNEDQLQALADRFNITVQELQAELDAGKTISEIAEERGNEELTHTGSSLQND
jgi:hypothetical protein